MIIPQTVYCWGSQCCVSLAELVSCLPICLPICLPPGFVFHLGWGAVSASLGLSPNLSPNLSPIWLCLLVFSPHLSLIWLCLSPWLGCCVRLAGLVCGLVSQFVSHLALSPSFLSPFVSHLALSFTLAGVLCPRRWACLLICLSPFVSPLPLCLSPWLGCCVRLAGLVSGLVSQFVSHLALSPSFLSPFVSHLALFFTLAGVLCPPRWACLRSCLPICLPPGFVFHLGLGCCVRLAAPNLSPNLSPPGFVFHLGWGAVSASLGLSPNLSPIWLCLSPWLGCCVRLAVACGLVYHFVSHLALSPSFLSPFVFHLALFFTLAGVCCVRLATLVSGLVSQFVSHLALSPSFVSPFVPHLALSFTLAGVLVSGLVSQWVYLSPISLCLPICLPSGFVFHLGWGAVSAPLGLSPNLSHLALGAVSASLGLSPNLSSNLFCLSSWLGRCVRLAGLACGLVSSGFVSEFSLPICFPSGFVFHLGWGAVSYSYYYHYYHYYHY